ncbi:hypothetical protein AVEN_2243-1, partial [Araneus ventricosus]
MPIHAAPRMGDYLFEHDDTVYPEGVEHGMGSETELVHAAPGMGDYLFEHDDTV